MKCLRNAILIPLILSIAAATPRHAAACSCYDLGWEYSFQIADAVFSGEILAVSAACDRFVQATMAVSECWKGTAAETITVSTHESGAACGAKFQVGQRAIFYVYDNGACDTDFYHSLCDRRATFDSATERALLGDPQSCTLAVEPSTWGRVKSFYVSPTQPR